MSEAADISQLTRLLLGGSPGFGLLGGVEHVDSRRVIAAALGEQVSTLVQRSRKQELLQVCGVLPETDPYIAW